ncbi:MAG: plastocyanin/azurin family copper-binding protein [Gemmatimonadota bacterium]
MMHLLRATTTAFSVAGLITIALNSASHVTPSHSSAPAPAMRATITVKMTGDAKGYRYEPSTINAKAGDEITFTNAMGGPHNVTFKAEEIPAGMATVLQGDMPKASAPLTSPLFETDGESWTMTTTGLKPGTYPFYCMPHAPLGMKGQLVIQ